MEGEKLNLFIRFKSKEEAELLEFVFKNSTAKSKRDLIVELLREKAEEIKKKLKFNKD